jgi:hypothetical protein
LYIITGKWQKGRRGLWVIRFQIKTDKAKRSPEEEIKVLGLVKLEISLSGTWETGALQNAESSVPCTALTVNQTKEQILNEIENLFLVDGKWIGLRMFDSPFTPSAFSGLWFTQQYACASPRNYILTILYICCVACISFRLFIKIYTAR